MDEMCGSCIMLMFVILTNPVIYASPCIKVDVCVYLNAWFCRLRWPSGRVIWRVRRWAATCERSPSTGSCRCRESSNYDRRLSSWPSASSTASFRFVMLKSPLTCGSNGHDVFYCSSVPWMTAAQCVRFDICSFACTLMHSVVFECF